jgi:hypothetical protein
MDLAGLDVHAAVAANLWPELSNTTQPSPTIASVVSRGGRLGSDASDEALRERRDRVLRGLPSLRDDS